MSDTSQENADGTTTTEQKNEQSRENADTRNEQQQNNNSTGDSKRGAEMTLLQELMSVKEKYKRARKETAAERKAREAAEVKAADATELAAMADQAAPVLEKATKQIEAYEATFKTLLDATVAKYGDAGKAFVDTLPASLTNAQKLELLTKNEQLFTSTTTPEATAGVDDSDNSAMKPTKTPPSDKPGKTNTADAEYEAVKSRAMSGDRKAKRQFMELWRRREDARISGKGGRPKTR